MGSDSVAGVENDLPGHRLPVWVVRACLGALVGCAMASRPCYWPAWPLVLSMGGVLAGACGVSTWIVCIGASLAMGWTPEHLAGGHSTEVAVVMLVFSSAAAMACSTEADRWLCLAVAMCLPGLWASNCAYHLVLALPFGLAWAAFGVWEEMRR